MTSSPPTTVMGMRLTLPPGRGMPNVMVKMSRLVKSAQAR